MRFQSKHAAVILGALTLAWALFEPVVVYGDDWNLSTRFTVNQPFEVPGIALQANTPYVIRLQDSPSDRHVVQIYNGDETRILTTFMGVSDERTEPSDKTVFTFYETQPGYPLPIKEWFYPGRSTGLEFIYPTSQATEIARHATESSSSGNLHDLATLRIAAIRPLGAGQPTALTATASKVTKTEDQPVDEEKSNAAESQEPVAIAQNNSESSGKKPIEVQREKPGQPLAVAEETGKAGPDSQPSKESAATELPRTGGELPLIALVGALALGAGLGLKVFFSR